MPTSISLAAFMCIASGLAKHALGSDSRSYPCGGAGRNDPACDGSKSMSPALLQQNTAKAALVKVQGEDDGGIDDCESDVGQVHSFTVNGSTRCFNLYTPSTMQTPMPVVVFFHGLGGKANAACKSGTELVSSADAMGFALLCADAFVNWQFPTVDDDVPGVNSGNPQPCSGDDTPDADYVSKVLDTIKGDSSTYDHTRVYFQGFSQGAMMTTWAATCFANQIRGASQAGSGLKVGLGAVTEEWCGNSQSKRCVVGETDGNNIPGGACSTGSSCEFFPIQPAKLTNVVGEDLKWCLYAGCSDYLLGSLLSQDQHLTSLGVPHDLVYYDSPHQAPSNWMPKVAQCHGWANAPQVDETPWLASCNGIDLGTNDVKYCLGETGCSDGESGGGIPGGSGSSGGCPAFCMDKMPLERACEAAVCAECDLDCSGGDGGGSGSGSPEGSGSDGGPPGGGSGGSGSGGDGSGKPEGSGGGSGGGGGGGGKPEGECKGFCQNHASKKGWSSVCNWSLCSGCDDCN